MAHEDPTPERVTTFYFGQPISYYAHLINDAGRQWCDGFVIQPIAADGEIGVAYYSQHDGHQWTDHARISDVRPRAEPRAANRDGWLSPDEVKEVRADEKRLLSDIEKLKTYNDGLNDELVELQNELDKERTRTSSVESQAHSLVLAQLAQHGLELHSKTYIKMLESKASAYDDLAGRLVQSTLKNPAVVVQHEPIDPDKPF